MERINRIDCHRENQSVNRVGDGARRSARDDDERADDTFKMSFEAI